MKEIQLKELLDIQKDILKRVHDFCISKNLRYYMCAGTLLGSIRHQGYIPWDDDIDIFMPRPDYEYFIHGFNGAYADLQVLAPEINSNHFETYANVHKTDTILEEFDNPHNGIEIGIKIDVFPLDGMPIDHVKYDMQVRSLRKLLQMCCYKRFTLVDTLRLLNKSIKSFAYILIFHKIRYMFVSYREMQSKMQEQANKYKFDNSKLVDVVVFNSFERPSHSIDEFREAIDVDFEEHKFKAMIGYSDYLSELFGDYMKLPPVEQRVSHHGFKAFWK